MSKAAALALLLVLGCIGIAAARPMLQDGVELVERRQLAATSALPGWYYSLRVKGGEWCRLKDFPPIPNGYGTSNLQCVFKAYNHQLMWRLEKVGTGTLNSGDKALISVVGPMLMYCQSTSRVICGVTTDDATEFTVEKASGTGAIDYTSDIVLKVGSSYCALVGGGHGQSLQCSTSSKASATVFNMPASSWANARIINLLSGYPCGSDFFPDGDGKPPVNCTSGGIAGWTNTFVLSLEKAGAPELPASLSVGFKAYNDLYRYQYSVFKASKKINEVIFVPNNAKGDNQFFTYSRVSGTGPLTNGTVIALKSNTMEKYCGIASAFSDAIKCDQSGPVSSLPNGYKYTFTIV